MSRSPAQLQIARVSTTAAGAGLEIMPGVAGLPDMVFPANAAIVLTAGRCLRGSAIPNARAKSSISRNTFAL